MDFTPSSHFLLLTFAMVNTSASIASSSSMVNLRARGGHTGTCPNSDITSCAGLASSIVLSASSPSCRYTLVRSSSSSSLSARRSLFLLSDGPVLLALCLPSDSSMVACTGATSNSMSISSSGTGIFSACSRMDSSAFSSMDSFWPLSNFCSSCLARYSSFRKSAFSSSFLSSSSIRTALYTRSRQTFECPRGWFSSPFNMDLHLAQPVPVYPTLSRCFWVIAIPLGAASARSRSAGRRSRGTFMYSTAGSTCSTPAGFHGVPVIAMTLSAFHCRSAGTCRTALVFATFPFSRATTCSSLPYLFPIQVPSIQRADISPPCGGPGIL